MLVFDLLEGNLSETEKSAAIERVNSDANLKKEYELLKKTYLQKVDAVHFPNKISLYSISSQTSRLFLLIKPIAAAAAFFIISGIGIYFFRSQAGSTGNSERSIIAKPIKTPTVKEDKPLPTAISTSATALKVSKIKQIKTDYPTADTAFAASPEKPEYSILSLTSTSPRTVAITKETDDEIEYRIAIYPQQSAPATNRKKRSLYYQLFRTGRTMLANLELPEIKIKTSKSKNHLPNINIQIYTPANYATYNEN